MNSSPEPRCIWAAARSSGRCKQEKVRKVEMRRCHSCMNPIGEERFCPHCGYDTWTVNAPHQLPVGTVLRQRYLLGKVLGQGGFGITYMGWDQVLNVPVAVKEYYPSGIVMRECTHSLGVTNCEGATGSQFADNRRRFLREAQSLAQLANVPEVVQVRDFFEENNTAYIVMEYISGMTLKAYLQGRGAALDLRQTLGILQSVFRGLEQVHAVGLIHRDISPDNIMLTADRRVKLLDFGAVREVNNADVEKELTKSTEAILKQGFAPLEQYQKKGTLGPWTDVYALCATIYYCLTGTAPQDAPGLLLEESKIPWEQIPGLTPRQAAVLAEGTAILPKNRIRSVSELDRKLGQALTDNSPYTAPVDPGDKTVPVQTGDGTGTTGARKPPVALAAAAAAVLIAAAAFLLGRGSGGADIPVSQTEIPQIRVEQTFPAEPETQPEQTRSQAESDSAQGHAKPVPETTEATIPARAGTPVAELDLIKDSDKNNNGKEVSTGRFKDAFGDYHEDSLSFMVINNKEYSRVAYVEYRLEGQYSVFSGNILPRSDCEDKAVMTVEIWLDGKKIYKSEDITRDWGEEFSVDVTGGKVLRIQCLTSVNHFGYCIVDGIAG